MPDNVQVKYIYPPNFSGTFNPGEKGFHRYVVKCTNLSIGDGESAAIKVNRSDLRTPDGNVPSKLVIEKVCGNVDGMNIEIGYDNETDDVAVRFGANDGAVEKCYKHVGGFVPMDAPDGAGNIILTTSLQEANDSYDLDIHVRVKD